MAKALTDGFDDLRSKWLRLCVGAVVATVVLEMMMRVGAPNMLGIPPMEPADLLTNIAGLPRGHILGTVAHFGLALIIFPLGYMLIAYRHFPGPILLKGALWGALLWLVAMVVVLPLAGVPIFFGFGMPMMAALIAHVAYGVILAAVVGKPN